MVEAFFASLKKEPIKRLIFRKRSLATADIEDYLTFYNRTRRHGYFGGVSPEQYDAAHDRQQLHSLHKTLAIPLSRRQEQELLASAPPLVLRSRPLLDK